MSNLAIPLPPEELLFMGRDPAKARAGGQRLARRLDTLGLLPSNGLLFDIGCGYGRLAYGLVDQGYDGEYVVIDIVKPRIDWLDEHFTSRAPSYTFHHADVRNERYNPTGKLDDVSYGHLFPRGQVPDLTVLTSVFTHMYSDDIRSHLTSIGDVMGQDSTLVFSCFIYDGPDSESVVTNTANYTFSHVLAPDCRVETLDAPLRAIAYTKRFFTDALAHVGLVPVDVHRGNWSGTFKGEMGQDWIVARAPDETAD